jgi:hypothetical protein
MKAPFKTVIRTEVLREKYTRPKGRLVKLHLECGHSLLTKTRPGSALRKRCSYCAVQFFETNPQTYGPKT